MKFALGEIRMIKEPIGVLLNKELPLKVSWRLNKLVKAFDKELVSIEDARIALVKKHGVDDGVGNFRVPEENMQEFIMEFNEFLNETVDIEFEPISVELLGDELTISAKDLLLLEKILV